jgi:carbonic anhydrase
VSATATGQATGDTLFYRYVTYEAPVTMRNDGRGLIATLQGEGQAGGIALGMDFPNQLVASYDIWQMAIHSPSEHTFGGEIVPLELQLFHRLVGLPAGEEAPPNATAVVALGFVGGVQPNSFLSSLRQGGLPDRPGGETLVNREYPAFLDFSEVLGRVENVSSPMSENGFWQYTGSMTTPPCSAGVQWFVRPEPLPADVDTLAEFRAAIEAVAGLSQTGDRGNNRALQHSCGRSVVWYPARDTSTKPGLPTPEPPSPAFEAAMATAGGEQEEFEASMEGAQGADTAESRYLQCAKELGEADSDLQGAEAQKNTECAGEAAAQRKLSQAGEGVTQIAAANELAGQQEACSSATAVVESLRAQVQVQRQQCENLRQTGSTTAAAAGEDYEDE